MLDGLVVDLGGGGAGGRRIFKNIFRWVNR